MAGPVVLQVEGRVEEGEIGEQPLGGAPHGKLEQVVIRLAGVVVDPLLDPEDLDGEDGGLSVPQAGSVASMTFFITMRPSGEVSMP